jgi:hypothetical protein
MKKLFKKNRFSKLNKEGAEFASNLCLKSYGTMSEYLASIMCCYIGTEYFLKFLRGEFSTENHECYKFIQNYEELTDLTEKKELAKFIKELLFFLILGIIFK